MSEHGEIQITCGSVTEANAIAHQLVEQRLAACVQSVAIGSVYEWAARSRTTARCCCW